MMRSRVVSALVLAPLALASVVMGPPLINLVVAIGGAIMIWEWDRITEPKISARARFALVGWTGLTLFSSLFTPVWFASAAVTLAIIWRAWLIGQNWRRLGWTLLGALWLVGACSAFIWLRAQPHGLVTTIWAFLLVWAEDTAAFVVGRTFGGPRLAPQISPNKTWIGLAGGIVSGVVISIILAGWVDIARPTRLVLPSVYLAILEQMGDMAESHAKRRFGVKDSSGLIPGHGGLLDRLDGMMAVVYGLVILELFGAEVW